MKFIAVLFLFFTLHLFGQNETTNHSFRFYKNGSYESTLELKIQAVFEKDTVTCEIKDKILLLPFADEIGSIIVTYKKEKYILNEINFSSIKNNADVIFGLEDDMKKFVPISPKFPTLYMVKNSMNSIKIDDIKNVKQICFISFALKQKENEKMSVRCYDKTIILK